jgi:hypothetical protein
MRKLSNTPDVSPPALARRPLGGILDPSSTCNCAL